MIRNTILLSTAILLTVAGSASAQLSRNFQCMDRQAPIAKRFAPGAGNSATALSGLRGLTQIQVGNFAAMLSSRFGISNTTAVAISNAFKAWTTKMARRFTKRGAVPRSGKLQRLVSKVVTDGPTDCDDGGNGGGGGSHTAPELDPTFFGTALISLLCGSMMLLDRRRA